MYKFQLTTKADLREAQIIAQKRRFEEERKERIFNARNRLFGVDLVSLREQIDEKKKIDALRREEDRQFEAEDARRATMIKESCDRMEKERLRVESEINDYRRTYQQRKDTREYDLNDPLYLKHGRSMREGDNDPRLGISSAQQFGGEDLMNPERRRQQRDQQRAWLQQQIDERRTTEGDRRLADRQLMAAAESRDRGAQQAAAAYEAERRLLNAAQADFNRKLAIEQAERRQRRQREEQQDNLAEIYNNLTSDMLSENTSGGQLNANGGKDMSNFRGLTPEQQEELLRDQREQQLERIAKDNDAKAMEAKWDSLANGMARETILQERELERKRHALEQTLAEENAQLAAEQRQRKQHLDKVVYTNRPTHEFFACFNTTTR